MNRSLLLKHRLQKIRKTIHKLFSYRRFFPFTTLGTILLLAALWVYFHFGRNQSDFILHSVCCVIFALEGLSLLIVLLGLIRVRRNVQTFEKEEQKIEVGQEIDLGFRLPSFRRFPLIDLCLRWISPDTVQVSLSEKTLEIDGKNRRRLFEQVVFEERGRFTEIIRSLELFDIFGLCSLEINLKSPCSLRIEPRPISTDAFCDLRQTSGEGFSHPLGNPTGDQVEIRRYSDGDPLRFVIWKIFARTRRLMVRTPERALNPEPSALGCFIAGEMDEPAAATAKLLLTSEIYGEHFTFLATGASQPAENPIQALDDLIDSVRYRDQGASDLAAQTAGLQSSMLESCVIFVPERLGNWIDPLRAFIGRLRRPPLILMATESSPPKKKNEALLQRIFKRLPEEKPEFIKTYQAIKQLGVPFQILHQPSGRWLLPEDLEAWR